MPTRKTPKFKNCKLCNIEFAVKHGNQKFCCVDHAVSGYYGLNKEEIRAQQKQKRNTPEFKLKRKLEHRCKSLQKYGVLNTSFDDLRAGQNNLCSICCSVLTDESIRIDHNHKTLSYRSLLCNECNSGLGYLKENISIMENMINYIKKHNGE